MEPSLGVRSVADAHVTSEVHPIVLLSSDVCAWRSVAGKQANASPSSVFIWDQPNTLVEEEEEVEQGSAAHDLSSHTPTTPVRCWPTVLDQSRYQSNLTVGTSNHA